ncbi:MAG: hypothetical protein A3H97_03245 [Acidobacteria bacterium RIFCSPLOWO2_02_FULL_65_29]|nr:MAG: hypothetical protein A3H97_03245 [Acidobacteria bacterium RIFCSPLOWO2_02_FULL_65_29]
MSGAELVELIIRHRRRIRLILFASYSCTTVAAGAIVTAAYQFRAGMGAGGAAAAGGLALGTAALLAWLRCPTVRATGARLDRELRLDDRVAAALEARDGHEPVAPLIVRDALLRLRGIKPAHVFPMKLGRPAALAAASFVCAALLSAIAVPPGPDRASAARGGGVSSATATGARSSAAGPLRGRSSDSNGERGVPGSAQVAAPSAAAGQQAAPAGGQPGTTATRAPGAQRGSTADSSQSPGGTTAGGASSGDGRRSTNSQSTADASGAGAAARGTASGATRATGAARGAAGRSGETVGGTAVGAGGVQGEALRSNAEVARTRAGGGRSSVTARADAAWTGAAAAVSSDDVPPRRRAYVRDYFIAIRRPEQK